MVDEGLRWRRADDEQRKEKRVTGTDEQELVAEGLRACVEGRRGPGQQVVNAVTGSGRERGRGGKMSRRWRERAHGRAEAGKQRAARLVATQGEDASMYYCNQRGRARWRPDAYYAHLAQGWCRWTNRWTNKTQRERRWQPSRAGDRLRWQGGAGVTGE